MVAARRVERKMAPAREKRYPQGLIAAGTAVRHTSSLGRASLAQQKEGSCSNSFLSFALCKEPSQGVLSLARSPHTHNTPSTSKSSRGKGSKVQESATIRTHSRHAVTKKNNPA